MLLDFRLNSIMNNSPSGNRVKPSIQTLAKASTIISSPHFSAGGESSSHFDSLVKNLSDWNPSIQQNENDDINEEIVDDFSQILWI